MALDLTMIQALAPDQASLAQANKLLQPKHWLSVARGAGSPVIWGECQGSGANPYRVVVDCDDHGYKCSCPSRKFPCKHSLALMWKFASDAAQFQEQPLPDWVQEWLGRRKRGPALLNTPIPALHKDIAQASAHVDAPAPPVDAAEQARKQRAAAQRKLDTDTLVRSGLEEFEQWLGDQLHGGVARFVDEAPARCRQIAARLVDAKAATFASRIDEFPARMLALGRAQRGLAALQEMGQWLLLARAWQQQPDDADARAGVVQAEGRDAVLTGSGLRVASLWEVVGEQIVTRRDGLVAQSTWLLDCASEQPRFAVLQDFFPASAGRRGAAFSPGQRLHAELAFYPGRYPLRAVLAQSLDGEAQTRLVIAPSDPLAVHRQHLAQVPWAPLTPLLLGPGRIDCDGEGAPWWCADDDGHFIPLASPSDLELLAALPLRSAAVLWDGQQGQLLAVDTAMGGLIV
ncbi:SWIM zinc finger family protein [Xanthomonas arboricola]|uniref:SWIM zinc finger family protein n=1 Tax=Xanthomonas arboricola TaxID=56448 RepID=UPI001FD6E6DC|nr:SWIM zinc finger family protein [Xanthomonas arboricola]UOT00311.1 SWIM zinc finger family protein [Xanthomonas arboricola]